MPEKHFIIRLSEAALIFVFFVTQKGEVEKFVVKLNAVIGDTIYELARYDSGFHTPHLDVLRPDGSKMKVIDYGMLENAQAMNVAIEDFSNNWEMYLERWQKWLEKQK